MVPCEAAGRVHGRLVLIVGSEQADDRVQIVVVDGSDELSDESVRACCGSRPPFDYTREYSL